MQVNLDDYQVGAALATALVNTAPEVQVSTGDTLVDADALRRLLAEHRLHRVPSPADVVRVRALRGELRAIVDDPDSVAALAGTLAARTGTGPTLSAGPDGSWRWQSSTRADAGLVEELTLLTAIGMLGTLRVLGPTRFRSCAAPDCGGAFVDVSRAGRRRYCVPEVCGNRINVANHRARRRTAATPPAR